MDNTFIIGLVLLVLIVLLVLVALLRTGRGASPKPEPPASIPGPQPPDVNVANGSSSMAKPLPQPSSSGKAVTNNYFGPTVVDGSTFLYSGRYRNTAAAREGRDGEDRVVQHLLSGLDGRWFVFRNVVLPGHSGDLDIVLVGPGGTWVLEAKAFTGQFRVLNGRWQKLTSNGYWANMPFGPGAQVMQNAARLCTFFKANGIMKGNAVNRAVVIAKETPIEVISAGNGIWRLDDLPRKLSSINHLKYHSSEQVARLTEALFTVTSTPSAVKSSAGR